MAKRIRAWWWIARHPFKTAAIRRYVQERAFSEAVREAKAEVWDVAYQAGAEDTLVSPRDARQNPYRAEQVLHVEPEDTDA